MRVCLSANARPRVGGQGVNLHHMLSALRALGHEAEVFQAGESEVFAVAPGSSLSRLIARVPYLRRRRNWIVGLDGRAFDRYVAHNMPAADVFQGVTGQCVRSLVSAAKRGIEPLLDSITEHIDGLGAAMDESCRDLGVVPPLGSTTRERMREEYRSARRIRVMSSVAAESFVSHGVASSRLRIVPPCVELPQTAADPAGLGSFSVSFVGLIEPWKGIRQLLEAYRMVGNSRSQLLLWGNTGSRAVAELVGRARVADSTIQMQTADVQADGFHAVYGRSSVLVHPSLSDGFGLVVLEAMATGIPVIVSAAAGASEIVEDGVHGYVVPPGDAGAIAERLEYLRDNPATIRAMGMAARDRAATFNLTAFCERYRGFLNGD